jgi:hypothetical protein
LVVALKGSLTKSVGFKPTEPRNFDGIRDQKVVDAWLMDMEDYIHATKVGRHSIVELAQSYLKGYAPHGVHMVEDGEARKREDPWLHMGILHGMHSVRIHSKEFRLYLKMHSL